MKLGTQTGFFRSLGFGAKALPVLVTAGLVGLGCTQADRPTKNKEVPPQAPEYGKFLEYRVGDGKISTLTPNTSISPVKIPYIVGEEFLPSRGPFLLQDYNYLHLGDGSDNPNQYFFYRDMNRVQRGASDHPEAVVIDNQLKLYFTNQPFTLPASNTLPGGVVSETFDTDLIPDDPFSPPVYINLNSYLIPSSQHGFVTMDGDNIDVDVLAFQITRENTPVQFRVAGRQYYAARYLSLRLTLLDQDGVTVLAQSRAGFDLYTFEDPEVGYVFSRRGTYFLVLEDLNAGQFPACTGANYTQNCMIYLFSESHTTSFAGEAFIRRGDLQPARSGNPALNGGKTFEADDLKTEVKDVFPDCDGIPNTGDEGDWGVNEICGDFTVGNGSQDGLMQYWEIDDKESLDDGEYWTAEETDLRSFGNEAPSVIVAPDGKKLWMWINAADGIYQLESLDGLEGLRWDLSNLLAHRPALRAGDNPDPDSPVVASGIYGFCETRADNSDVQVVDLCTVKGNPVGCKGYPKTVAVTFGEDSMLDTPAQSDAVDRSRNVITSGPDGIINTFFLPTHLHYGAPFHLVEVTVPTNGGPGNPDAQCADVVPTANDQNAYLLGDDVWAPELTVTPAEYWRNHHCVFFQLGDEFNRCAMGIPDTVAIRPGSDGRLNTITQILKDKGDDELCHAGTQTGICPGPDGVFSWADIYLPLRGDDELCIETDPMLMTPEAAICPGPDGVLDTVFIYTFSNVNELSAMNLAPPNLPPAEDGDVCCSCVDPTEVDLLCPVSGCAAICPGDDHKLQSLYTLYFSDISRYDPAGGRPVVFGKSDLYHDFDDEMCVLGGQIALCPGQNGYFQGYPVSRHLVVREYDGYEDLLKNYTGAPNDCYSLEVHIKQDSFGENKIKVFTLYRHEGVMFDDEIHWDPVRQEYYISTGANGINQTCAAAVDTQLIPHFRGLPNQPIILPGKNGVLDTPALADEAEATVIEGDFPLKKINTGADGISNSFAFGDDRVEIYLGTGKPDWPCVRAGGDGMADTAAQGNDTQLFQPGEVTGFDAYRVGYPDVVREGDQLYLFYTGLGWAQAPYAWRPSRGAFAKLGECDRAGLDKLWGNNDTLYEFYWITNPPFIRLRYLYERTLVDRNGDPRYRFLHVLDNNQGVLMAPRIGVATSTIQRIQADPTDWDKHPKPVVDLATFCAKSFDMPIDLGLPTPKLFNPPNYSGAFSSDTYIYHEPSDGQPIFVMVFSGLPSQSDEEASDAEAGTHESFIYNIGMARSLDGKKWDVAYDLGRLVVDPDAALSEALTGAITNARYRHPTLARGEKDSYQLFFNHFETLLGSSSTINTAQLGPDARAWIGFAVRKGVVPAGACFDVAGSASLTRQNRHEMILSTLIIALPVLLGIGWHLFRKPSPRSC